MSAESTAAGSLSFLLDYIPAIVIVIIIIAIIVSRHRYLKEKRELNAAIAECEKNNVQDQD